MLTRLVRLLRRVRLVRAWALRRARRRRVTRVRRAVLRRARRRRFGATATLRPFRRIPFSAARRRAADERRDLPGRPAFPARLRAAQYRLSAAGCPLRRFFRAIDVLLMRARRPRLTDFLRRARVCAASPRSIGRAVLLARPPLDRRRFMSLASRLPAATRAGLLRFRAGFSAPPAFTRALPRILSPRRLPLTKRMGTPREGENA
jgi:hypothetical protein